jgi:erythromycin esterase-like protein
MRAQCQNIVFRKSEEWGKAFVLQDEGMASNLLWLLENKYKHEKIIV